MHSAQGHALTRGLDVVEPFTVLGFDADIDRVGATLEAAINRPDIDSVVLCFVPPLGAWDEDFLAVLVEQARRCPTTVVACVPGIRGVEFAKIGGLIPVYDDPADAVGVLASVTDYAHWLDQDDDTFEPPHGINPEQAHALLHKVVPATGEHNPDRDCIHRLLNTYGITWPDELPPLGTASVHVRAVDDPLLGPVVSVAVVGDAEDLFHDVAYRAAPMSLHNARDMISSLKASPALLRTAPGHPDATADALADLISRVSWLVHHHDSIRALHLGRAWSTGHTHGLGKVNLTVGQSVGRRDQVARVAP